VGGEADWEIDRSQGRGMARTGDPGRCAA